MSTNQQQIPAIPCDVTGFYVPNLTGEEPRASCSEANTKCIESRVANLERIIEASYDQRDKLNVSKLRIQLEEMRGQRNLAERARNEWEHEAKKLRAELANAQKEKNDAFKARDQLNSWKEQTLEVFKGYDAQALGKLLELPLGTMVLPQIEPAVKKLIERVDFTEALLKQAESERDELGQRLNESKVRSNLAAASRDAAIKERDQARALHDEASRKLDAHNRFDEVIKNHSVVPPGRLEELEKAEAELKELKANPTAAESNALLSAKVCAFNVERKADFLGRLLKKNGEKRRMLRNALAIAQDRIKELESADIVPKGVEVIGCSDIVEVLKSAAEKLESAAEKLYGVSKRSEYECGIEAAKLRIMAARLKGEKPDKSDLDEVAESVQSSDGT